jgi:integrase
MWLPVILLGIATGARPSELVPVRVGDLDLDDPSGVGKWTINHHFGCMANLIPGTKTTEEDPRVAFLAPDITARLKPLLKHRFPAEFLVPGRSALGCRDKSGITDMLRRVAKRVGLPETLAGKVFRQTHTTLSRLQGVPDLALQAQLGHQSPQTTDIYTRFPEQALRDARLRLGSLIPTAAASEKVGTKVGTATGCDE